MAPRRGPARFTEAKAERYLAASTRPARQLEADTHVESYEDVLSDAGSTPAASIRLGRFAPSLMASHSPAPEANALSERSETKGFRQPQISGRVEGHTRPHSWQAIRLMASHQHSSPFQTH